MIAIIITAILITIVFFTIVITAIKIASKKETEIYTNGIEVDSIVVKCE